MLSRRADSNCGPAVYECVPGVRNIGGFSNVPARRADRAAAHDERVEDTALVRRGIRTGQRGYPPAPASTPGSSDARTSMPAAANARASTGSFVCGAMMISPAS